MDELTLTIVLGFTSLTASAMFFWLASHAREIPGIRYWAIGCLGVGATLFIALPRVVPDWQLASLLANSFFGVGQAFLLAGTLRFCGRGSSREVLALFAALAIVLTVVFTFIVADGRWRIGSLALHQAVVKAWMAIVLWQYSKASTRLALCIASGVMALEATACLVQVGVIAASSQPLSFRSPELPMMNLILWSTTLVSTVIGNWILFLLVALRLAADRMRERDLARAAEHRANEASEAKSVFLANMSHELRTPLNAVLGFARLMRRSPRLGSADRDNLAIIHESGEHLLEMINQVLSISKIEAGSMTLSERPFDLRELIRTIERMFQSRCEEAGLGFQLELDPALPVAVRGDAAKLRQVLINLLGNAVKFTDSGAVGLRVRWQAPSIRFEVTDTGHGIAEHELPTLFQPFVQAEAGRSAKEGTGLGLAITQRIVTLMGGEVSVESRLGVGTTFSFDLVLEPCAPVALAQRPAPVVGLAPGERAPRIAVVDDAPKNRALLQRLLAAVGIEVRTAEDGEQALALWREWRPEMIFMDVRMPVLDGREATRRIRAEELRTGAARVVIVAVTASVFESQGGALLADGFDEVIHKPFRDESIFSAIAARLGTRFVHETAGDGSSGPGARRTGKRSQPTSERSGGATAAEAVSAETDAIATPDGHRPRVLIVDDDPINRAVVREILAASCDTFEADDGAAALRALDGGKIDLVLLDVEMPTMGGIETVRRIRAEQRFGQMPVLAMTAHADADDVARLEAAGMDGHLCKPIDPERLLSSITDWLKRTRRRSGRPASTPE